MARPVRDCFALTPNRFVRFGKSSASPKGSGAGRGAPRGSEEGHRGAEGRHHGRPWRALGKDGSSILADLRPQLPASLRKLPDGHLLALINWSIIHSWNKAVAKALDNR